jgi:type II secretory pathway pseudopilin PulG
MINYIKKRKGFIILDLIIVVSLIALAYFTYNYTIEKRIDRDANAVKTQVVVNYIEALEKYREDNGFYPEHGVFNEDEKQLNCLGRASVGTRCMKEAWIHSEFLTLDIENYYPEVPRVIFPELADGIAYGCDRGSERDFCDGYVLEWFVDGDVSCDLGEYEYESTLGKFELELRSEELTFCRYVSS